MAAGGAKGGTRCMWMRGGTSKGGYFLAADLPADTARRDAFLLGVMGSPDARQIDGMGGGNPLASKVAVVSASGLPGADVDYLFLQVSVDEAIVSDAQNCGNILAGVAGFAVERGLVKAGDPETRVAIRMLNSGRLAHAAIPTPGGVPDYSGKQSIDGVPGSAAAVRLLFDDLAGSSCGALLPTGNPSDEVEGCRVTMIDNGMPVVVMRAGDMGVSGDETPGELDANDSLKARLERVRLACGPLMNLGDVARKTVPKMMMVSAPAHGGAFGTRCFIPHRCHESIGVFAAVSAATAAMIEGGVLAGLAVIPGGATRTLDVEHPGGAMRCVLECDGAGRVVRAGMVRTARKLFDGEVF